MQEDSYPREVIILVMTDSSVNIFGDSIGEGIYFQYIWGPTSDHIEELEISMAQSFEKKFQENCCLF